MRMKFISLLVFTLSLFLPLILLSQTGPGTGAPDPCEGIPNCEPERVPITGAIVYLIIAALGIGIKTFLKNKKR